MMVAGRRSLEKACERPQIIIKNRFILYNVHFLRLSCGGADRRQNIGGFIVPVAAATQIAISRWQTARL
jgi:hypothetical protein